MATLTPSTKARTWKRLIAEWQHSGQTPAAFCKARKLRKNQFHYWRPKVAATLAEAAARPFVPVTVASPTSVAAAEFVLGSRLVLRLAGDVSVARLVELAQALQAAGC